MDLELAKNSLTELSSARKIVLLFFLCLAQFLDTFNISALFSAIPKIATSTGLSNTQSVWINSAYQLTFAALLLISGRMSDIYNPKIVFLAGMYIMGFLSLGTGLTRDAVTILVLRGISGIGAALSIPSSLNLLVHTFPDPLAQARAIGAFTGIGALGNVLGVIIGALLISYASWPWVFYLASILALIIAIPCTVLIPHVPRAQNKYSVLEQLRRLDVIGGSLLIAALVLLIYAVTSGSSNGWKDATTALVTLLLSIILFCSFFAWEGQVSYDHASLPPHLWLYPNFLSLAILALLPYAWWATVYMIFGWYWQEVRNWSAISCGIHFLPLGIVTGPVIGLSSALQQKFEAKFILLGGLFLILAGTIFLPFAGHLNSYWPFVFPGLVLGTAGTGIIFSTTNIAMFASTPPEMAGTVGAVFNCALQIGAALFTALATSIQTSIQHDATSFKGRSAAFEFMIAFIVLQIISVLVFVRRTDDSSESSDPSVKGASGGLVTSDKKFTATVWRYTARWWRSTQLCCDRLVEALPVGRRKS